ncbi:MAG TPA: hypothetical protein VMT35_01535, partial [Ignavibacteriaceae bacterium]|nr:hypothetical protein [Ignavibacteriaceae bacterium]
MPPILALTLCVGLIALLLWIERKRNPLSSLALWIPTFYMLIQGSRPFGSWFEQSRSSYYIDTWTIESVDLDAGSPVSRLVLIALLLFSLLILFRRKTKWPLIFKDNLALILLFIFLGISILWSDSAFSSFKSWIRLAEAIPIAMVVLSERAPLEALESVFRRCAYVLVPLSLVLIKYYPHLGVLYGRWSGMSMWIGVTPDKNSLSQLCVLSILLIVWAYFRDRQAKNLSRDRSAIYADSFVFAIAIFLLFGSGTKGSATSEVVLIIGSASLLLLYGMYNSARHIAVYLVFAAVLMWPTLIFCDSVLVEVTSALGRDPSL